MKGLGRGKGLLVGFSLLTLAASPGDVGAFMQAERDDHDRINLPVSMVTDHGKHVDTEETLLLLAHTKSEIRERDARVKSALNGVCPMCDRSKERRPTRSNRQSGR